MRIEMLPGIAAPQPDRASPTGDGPEADQGGGTFVAVMDAITASAKTPVCAGQEAPSAEQDEKKAEPSLADATLAAPAFDRVVAEIPHFGKTPARDDHQAPSAEPNAKQAEYSPGEETLAVPAFDRVEAESRPQSIMGSPAVPEMAEGIPPEATLHSGSASPQVPSVTQAGSRPGNTDLSSGREAVGISVSRHASQTKRPLPSSGRESEAVPLLGPVEPAAVEASDSGEILSTLESQSEPVLIAIAPVGRADDMALTQPQVAKIAMEKATVPDSNPDGTAAPQAPDSGEPSLAQPKPLSAEIRFDSAAESAAVPTSNRPSGIPVSRQVATPASPEARLQPSGPPVASSKVDQLSYVPPHQPPVNREPISVSEPEVSLDRPQVNEALPPLDEKGENDALIKKASPPASDEMWIAGHAEPPAAGSAWMPRMKGNMQEQGDAAIAPTQGQAEIRVPQRSWRSAADEFLRIALGLRGADLIPTDKPLSAPAGKAFGNAKDGQGPIGLIGSETAADPISSLPPSLAGQLPVEGAESTSPAPTALPDSITSSLPRTATLQSEATRDPGRGRMPLPAGESAPGHAAPSAPAGGYPKIAEPVVSIEAAAATISKEPGPVQTADQSDEKASDDVPDEREGLRGIRLFRHTGRAPAATEIPAAASRNAGLIRGLLPLSGLDLALLAGTETGGSPQPELRRPSSGENRTADEAGKSKSAEPPAPAIDAAETRSAADNDEAPRPFFAGQPARAAIHETAFPAPSRPGQQAVSASSASWAAGSQAPTQSAAADLRALSAMLTPKHTATAPDGDFLTQLAERIQMQLRDGESVMRIQLKPNALGRLEIKAETSASGVLATILTESAGVKNYLEHNLHLLHQSFQDQGLKIDRIHVIVQEGFLPQHPSSGHQDPRSGPGRQDSSNAGGWFGNHFDSPGEELALDAPTLAILSPHSTFHTVA